MQEPSCVQALSLLFAAFVVLGLDAYLFGLVTGDAGQLTRRRAWTEAMYAAGLLGVGFWDPIRFWPKVIIGGTAVWVLGVSLVPLWYLVIRLVPPFDEESES